MPSVTGFDDSIHRGGTVAADPDWRTLWPRQKYERRKLYKRTIVGSGNVGAEQMMNHGERLVGNRATAMSVHAERVELRLHPSDSDAEDQTLARQFLDGRALLRGQHGGPRWDDPSPDDAPTLIGWPGAESRRP